MFPKHFYSTKPSVANSDQDTNIADLLYCWNVSYWSYFHKKQGVEVLSRIFINCLRLDFVFNEVNGKNKSFVRHTCTKHSFCCYISFELQTIIEVLNVLILDFTTLSFPEISIKSHLRCLRVLKSPGLANFLNYFFSKIIGNSIEDSCLKFPENETISYRVVFHPEVFLEQVYANIDC